MAPGLLLISFIIWALTTLFCLSHSEIFTALIHMTDFVSMEQSLLSALDEYVQYDPASPADVKRFANSVKKHIGRIDEEDMELFLGHPVNSYLLVRRFYKEWREITNKVNESVPQGRELHALMEEYHSSFPGLQDLHGCVLGILRIQNVYHISAETIASGKLSNKTLSPELNAVDCMEMGHVNDEWEKYEAAYGWFMEAWKRLSQLDLDSGLTKKDVLQYLIWAEYKTGRIQEALDHTNELLKEDPENEEAQQGKKYYEYKLQVWEDMEKEEDEQEKSAEDTRQPEEFVLHYEQMCRGTVNKSQAELDKLTCYYFNKHSLLVIRPVKIEMANLKPDIFLLHDVIRDKDIALIKKLAAPKLERATVTNRETGNLEFADYRISESAWLEDYESDVVSRLSLQLEAITGLSTAQIHSEALQVVNYGIGGQYEPHVDHALNKKSAIFRMGMRNRIATVLIYMTDVEAGGSTVFLDAQAKIEARKGTAAFWFNLRKSGESDGTTRHAACPVIVGTKWVANKWIHENGQEFRRRCGLSPDV